MTELLYQTDSYLKQFSAKIVGVDEEKHALLLDSTAFYPGGGGQPADSGTLTADSSRMAVKRARKKGQEVWHTIADDTPLATVGTLIEGEIDWERRYQLMRTHSAMHVLCGTIFRDYGAKVTGGEMESLKARMDFEFETLTKDLVKIIEDSINIEAAKAHPLNVSILPREEAFLIPDLIRTKINLLPPQITEVRVVEIVGLDIQADGGTHVRNTSEIGKIRVVNYKSKGKINKRLYVELD